MTLQACLKSMRLRTLPLSLSGTVVGISSLGASGYSHPVPTVILLILTTALLQVLSNLSNELGDTLHGTDTAARQGMHYSLQDGDMSIPEMKRLIAGTVAACCLSGLGMILCSFGTLLSVEPAALLLLGAAAIWAAMHYTLGRNPYGYRGLGDLFVFIFFGLVSTCGACYVCSHQAGLAAVLANSLLPACAIGCFSIGVLNVNNIRDAATDAENRVTVAIRLGGKGARIYQNLLLALGWTLLWAHNAGASAALFGAEVSAPGRPWRYIIVLTLPLFFLHLRGIWTREGRALDPMLPLLVMSTFALSILWGVGSIL
ncbi:MAG: 1,4-dihydroxy-2-naphthoate octaprenyltransferase [Bacteroidales bacterium]|nr:1,4-dihydroxy-2-naphthoate octaprenyltransferase [Bacteroidales bacterium]